MGEVCESRAAGLPFPPSAPAAPKRVRIFGPHRRGCGHADNPSNKTGDRRAGSHLVGGGGCVISATDRIVNILIII